MKKRVGVLAATLLSVAMQAQDDQKATTVSSIKGVNISLVGLGLEYEAKLGKTLTLETEAGIALNFYTYDESVTRETKTATIWTPYIKVEPRWYYGLQRRVRLGKNTRNNGANYFSLINQYNFLENGFGLTKNTNLVIANALTITPAFTIRRNFAKNFNYSFGFGISYQYNFLPDNYKTTCNSCTKESVVPYLDAKIGYNF